MHIGLFDIVPKRKRVKAYLDVKRTVSQLIINELKEEGAKDKIIEIFDQCVKGVIEDHIEVRVIEKIDQLREKTPLTPFLKKTEIALSETFPSAKMAGNYALLTIALGSSIVAADQAEKRNAAIVSTAITVTAIVTNYIRNFRSIK
jgi:hypothetical protein